MNAAVRPTSGAGASLLWLPLLVLCTLAAPAAPAAAQDPVPRDTVPRDTIPRDTVPPIPGDPDARMPQDTAGLPEQGPVVHFPRMPLAPAAGFAAGEWVWDREALLREAATSLIELLERIPGIAPFRAGMFAQPEAAAAFGGTAGRVEVEVDGYVIDPLTTASLDLAHMPLVHFRALHVQRRLGLLRIRILTEEARDPVPYTRVEAGIGQPPANLFRGILLAPHVILGPLGFGIERLDTDGLNRSEPASVFSGWAKWSWTDGRRGVQLEVLRSTLEREPNSPWRLDRVRQDLVLRARNAFAPGLLGEIYAGRSTVTDSVPRPAGDTITSPLARYGGVQAGGRLVYQLPLGTVQARARYREAATLPRFEAGVEGDFSVGRARAGGEVSHAGWDDIGGATYYAAHGELGLLLGASAFAELTGGSRGAPPYSHGDGGAVLTERSGWRAGLAATVLGGRVTGSAAAFGLEQDASRPFGLPFDSAAGPVPAGPGRGFEGFGRVVLLPGWFAVEGWISEWTRADDWIYVPTRSWRTALELHALPLPSGNLEVLGRLEAARRGGLLSFLPGPRTGEESGIAILPAYTRINGYLQIRVIDVRMFLRWEDLLGQQIEDLPGRIHRGPRILYGVKWNLWN
jgi:hypothetical protein